jgi:NAD(P)H-dependent flavin oxidoreductase YrpB (nitropropane dioxygenase family)
MVVMTNFSDLVKTAIAEKADIIFSGAGLPLDLPSFLTKDSTTKLVPIVSSARAAKIICEKWKNNYNYLPDAIVVEGPKAGGHLGFKPEQIEDEQYTLEKLIPQVVKEVEQFEQPIPVIAAGGIYTGKDFFDFLKLGASGVQLGTLFVTTDECDASDAFKNSYIEARKEDIEIIKSPVGMPGRAIKNDFIDQVNKGDKQPDKCPYHCIKTCDYKTTPYCICFALLNAFKGNFKNGYAFAGTNAFKATRIISVKETIRIFMNEYKLCV